jgi:hypothetical protein
MALMKGRPDAPNEEEDNGRSADHCNLPDAGSDVDSSLYAMNSASMDAVVVDPKSVSKDSGFPSYVSSKDWAVMSRQGAPHSGGREDTIPGGIRR